MFRITFISSLVFILLGPISPNFFIIEPIKESVIVFCSESSLKIKVKTNVNEVECEFNKSLFLNSLRVKFYNYKTHIEFEDTYAILPNDEFNCGGEVINKDFHKLLNTKVYPDIKIFLKEISHDSLKNGVVKALVDVELSGVVKAYELPISYTQAQTLLVSGSLPVNIEDFGLKPPIKLLGMIKVQPEIIIDFALNIELQQKD